MIAVSNSLGNSKLIFEDVVGLLLNEEVRRRSNGGVSSSALNVENRERGLDRSTRSMSKSRRKKSKFGGAWKVECWNYGKKGHLKEYKAPRKNGGGGGHDKVYANISAEEYQSDSLVLPLDNTKSWVLGSGPSFHASPNTRVFKNYIQENIGAVYLEDNKACNITGMGDVYIRMS